jgi:DMSO/TMAO reductase YedYZ molybdopterin-dependent catalytic subunit
MDYVLCSKEKREGTEMSGIFFEGVGGLYSRRGFVRLCLASALTWALPACKERGSVGYRPRAGEQTPYITPNSDFYLVAVDPSFRPSFGLANVSVNWSLPVQGLGGNINRYGYEELVKAASRVVPYTFECIGNPVGGQLIGNARWHVVPLKEIIKKAANGSKSVKTVMFEGLDDFYSSVSVERAVDDYAFIALKMNGDPLPAGHGFPARVILPDLYGMKQPRWLRRIRLLEDAQTTSYWEKRGWAGEVPVKTMSRLDPRGVLKAREPAELTGIAFAGARGISKVEVSFDGKDWEQCEMLRPPERHVWSPWRYVWRRPASGRYTVMVRATDGNGVLQTSRRTGRFSDGASGYHQEKLVVKTGGSQSA